MIFGSFLAGLMAATAIFLTCGCRAGARAKARGR